MLWCHVRHISPGADSKQQQSSAIGTQFYGAHSALLAAPTRRKHKWITRTTLKYCCCCCCCCLGSAAGCCCMCARSPPTFAGAQSGAKMSEAGYGCERAPALCVCAVCVCVFSCRSPKRIVKLYNQLYCLPRAHLRICPYQAFNMHIHNTHMHKLAIVLHL